MNVVDLFAGVGGLSYGFSLAGAKILFANEINQDIAKGYIKNHPNTNMVVEDITKLDISLNFSNLLGNVDVVIGGPPCQGFSQKGSRKSINDERNFLFRYYFEVVKYLKPKYFIIENVPNLLTAEKGYFKEEIYALFKSIGYSLDSKVLNAADFGVPQVRKRAIILGKLGDSALTIPNGNKSRVSVKDAIYDLAFLESGEGEEKQQYRIAPMSEYQINSRKNSEFLYNHVVTKHSEEAISKLKLIPKGKGKEVLPKHLLTKSVHSGTWSRLIEDKPSVTITTRFDTPSSGRFTHPFLNRCITVREAARLQSFPDTFIFYGSKTIQMKQVGNAVPPLLGKALATIIFDDINNSKTI